MRAGLRFDGVLDYEFSSPIQHQVLLKLKKLNVRRGLNKTVVKPFPRTGGSGGSPVADYRVEGPRVRALSRPTINPWPNASHRKSTQVLLLALTCVSFGHQLALTFIDSRGLATAFVQLASLASKNLRLLARTCVSFGHGFRESAAFVMTSANGLTFKSSRTRT